MPRNILKVRKSCGTVFYRVRIRPAGHKPLSGNFDRYDDAVDFRNRMLGRVGDIKARDMDSRLTIAEAVAAFYESQDFARIRTQRQRRQHLTYWCERVGKLPMAELRPARIEEESRRLAADGQAPATTLKCLMALSKLYTFAARVLNGPLNPVAATRKPKADKAVPRALDDSERRVLLDACDRSEWPLLGLLVRLALITTARRSSLIERRWRDVDLSRGVITIPRTKNGDSMELVVSGRVLEMLRAQAKRTGAPRSALIFPSERKPDVPFEFRDHFTRAVRDAELEDVQFKSLRSTGITHYLHNTDLKTTQKISGHRTPQVLLTHYAHVSDRQKIAAVMAHSPELLGD